MKYNIRHGFFETNSSSSHSVTIAKTADNHANVNNGKQLISIVRSFEAKCRFIADAVTCERVKEAEDVEDMWSLIELVGEIYAEKTGKTLDLSHLKKMGDYRYEPKCAEYFNNNILNEHSGCRFNCYVGILCELSNVTNKGGTTRQELTELLTGDYDFLLYEGCYGGNWGKTLEIY